MSHVLYRPAVRPLKVGTQFEDLGDIMPDWSWRGERLFITLWNFEEWHEHPLYEAVMGNCAIWVYEGQVLRQTKVTVAPGLSLVSVEAG